MKQFSFLFGLSLAIEILSITDLLATKLQEKTLSAYDGKKLAEKCIITLKAMTLEFDSVWDKIVTKANELEVENTKLPRKVVKPLRFRDFADDTTENAPTTEKEYFENIYIEAFQNVTECLTKRFNQKGLEYYDDLQQVLLLVAKNQPYEEKLKKIHNNERSHDFNEEKLRIFENFGPKWH